MIHVAALYQFFAFPDYRGLQAAIRDLAATRDLRGTLLLAPEGVNGTLAGERGALESFVAGLDDLLGGRLNAPELKYSTAARMPFGRLKIRLKKEIVTLAAPEADPARTAGTYVAPADWNALIAQPDVLLIDTRNQYEVEMGTFDDALDPKIRHFTEFKRFVAENLNPGTHRRIAMFCTGGIRCEKASAYMLAHGFEEVYHLKGGILKYLEQIPPEQSRWQGGCFVFDERVALGHGLEEQGN